MVCLEDGAALLTCGNAGSGGGFRCVWRAKFRRDSAGDRLHRSPDAGFSVSARCCLRLRFTIQTNPPTASKSAGAATIPVRSAEPPATPAPPGDPFRVAALRQAQSLSRQPTCRWGMAPALLGCLAMTASTRSANRAQVRQGGSDAPLGTRRGTPRLSVVGKTFGAA